ncbi:glycosyltransferase family 4 protein [Caldilinea sp.]|uniref:glycosyltransferase family 4 protein n=1 Tax=Caldilinea sp. TaxID=2293560 RepID=UPI002BA42DB9|nr:glycosyltransferase family 4 protein [Caldilinea sp.]
MKFALVSPRYGADLGGGAEMLARGLMRELARQGHTVEVWTSCARDHYTWRNELPAGESTIDGIRTLRFPIDHWNLSERVRLETQLNAYHHLSTDDQYAWVESGPISSALCRHVAARADAFDGIIALPYANPMVHAAAWMAPARMLLWPCLHNEPYAYLEPVHLLLESVWGVLFNSPEEQLLASEKIAATMPRHAVMGVGVELAAPAPASVRAPVPTVKPRRGLLYVGRLEGGKNVSLLYSYVRRMALEGCDISLTVAGSGPLHPPARPAFRDLGYVDEATKAALYSNALALVQPSENESFSIVAMEGWLCATPAIVNDGCAVTRGHVLRSRGGLAYQGYADFAEAVLWLQQHPELAQRMGANGKQYVQANYAWPTVARRFVDTVARWNSERAR